MFLLLAPLTGKLAHGVCQGSVESRACFVLKFQFPQVKCFQNVLRHNDCVDPDWMPFSVKLDLYTSPCHWDILKAGVKKHQQRHSRHGSIKGLQ